MECFSTWFSAMESVASSSMIFKDEDDDGSFSQQQESLFADSVRDLINLKKQFYSAAEYFELSYKKDDHRKVVQESLKNYAIKAFGETVDQLGFMSNQLNRSLESNLRNVLRVDLQFSRIEQGVKVCQESFYQDCRQQQAVVVEFPKYDKHYILPVVPKEPAKKCSSSTIRTDENSTLSSPNSVSHDDDNREMSPDNKFSFAHPPSRVRKSTFLRIFKANRRVQSSANRRSPVTFCAWPERRKRKDSGSIPRVSRGLVKALMKIRKPKKDMP